MLPSIFRITEGHTMRRMKVRIAGQQPAEYFVIRDHKDFKELCDLVQVAVGNLTKRLINTNVPVDRWDHLRYGGFEGALLTQLLIKMKFTEVIPLVEPGILAKERMTALIDYLMRDETLLVNDKLGYCVLTDDIEVLGEWEWQLDKTKFYSIVPGSRCINLENDETLEQHTRDYFAAKGEPFSYITSLHRFDKEELVEIFKRFKAAGGSVVYVFTTGSNVAQMYDYYEAALDAGITHFVFDWSAEVTAAVDRFIDHARRKATVVIENEK